MADIRRLPGPIADLWNWQFEGNCFLQENVDETLFFHPEGERGPARAAREAAAKAICEGCPVKQQCLDHSLRTREPYGVWGGLSENEREQLLANQLELVSIT